jgi:hypothetical protein
MPHEGVWKLFDDDLKLSLEERYIHGITSSSTGGKVIFTFNPQLLALLHSAIQFEVDGTFKRVEGEFDEWEITVWERSINAGNHSRSFHPSIISDDYC